MYNVIVTILLIITILYIISFKTENKISNKQVTTGTNLKHNTAPRSFLDEIYM